MSSWKRGQSSYHAAQAACMNRQVSRAVLMAAEDSGGRGGGGGGGTGSSSPDEGVSELSLES